MVRVAQMGQIKENEVLKRMSSRQIQCYLPFSMSRKLGGYPVVFAVKLHLSDALGIRINPGSEAARKDDAPAAVQAAFTNLAGVIPFCGGGCGGCTQFRNAATQS
jgi:hypothetical protein